eukprot:12706933-Alexandrium_andersonii.AAC.1
MAKAKATKHVANKSQKVVSRPQSMDRRLVVLPGCAPVMLDPVLDGLMRKHRSLVESTFAEFKGQRDLGSLEVFSGAAAITRSMREMGTDWAAKTKRCSLSAPGA